MENNNRNNSNEQQNQGAQQGEYKNVETSVNNPSYFDDSYESKAEDEITDEEPKTENEGRTGKQ